MSTVIYISGKTQGGLDWIPRFVQAINPDTCIGCGRCYKVCGRDVLTLVEAELDEEENQRMIMTVENPHNCIGCEACAKVCTKKCHTHAPTPEA